MDTVSSCVQGSSDSQHDPAVGDGSNTETCTEEASCKRLYNETDDTQGQSGATKHADSDISRKDIACAGSTRASEFTSEIYKLHIRGLNRNIHHSGIKKVVCNACGFPPVKVIKAKNWDHCFVTFRSEEQCTAALDALSGLHDRGCTWQAKRAEAKQDPIQNKRRRVESKASRDTHHCVDDSLPLHERLSNKVTPLWNKPYDQQLVLKKNELRKKLKQVFTESTIRDLQWVVTGRKENEGGIPCPMDAVVASPVVEGYRNKCEFTIGLGVDGLPTVGHPLGSYYQGILQVVGPTHCKHLAPAAIKLAAAIQAMIRESSLKYYNREIHEGFWRQVTIRTSSSGELMCIVMVKKRDQDEDIVAAEISKLKTTLAEMQDPVVTSSYLVDNASVSGARDDTDEIVYHLGGTACISETLCGVSFQISPKAFFQVNTAAAEVLMGIVKQSCAQLDKNTVLLDICCGTGTIGIPLARNVHKVYGVDICEESIVDAQANCVSNNVTNCEYIAGKAEDVIVRIMKGVAADVQQNKDIKVVGIVDPPRPGLHKSVIREIRRNEGIEQLIYISCSIGGAGANVAELCRPRSKRVASTPFVLKKAIPVDLFPQTLHCELLLVFERALV
eukprot:m.1034982 g.1034982  ORF g.1034982 m.1034982 type:complete len:616 (+) comp24136_c1_seq15:90-1937(+)